MYCYFSHMFHNIFVWILYIFILLVPFGLVHFSKQLFISIFCGWDQWARVDFQTSLIVNSLFCWLQPENVTMTTFPKPGSIVVLTLSVSFKFLHKLLAGMEHSLDFIAIYLMIRKDTSDFSLSVSISGSLWSLGIIYLLTRHSSLGQSRLSVRVALKVLP